MMMMMMMMNKVVQNEHHNTKISTKFAALLRIYSTTQISQHDTNFRETNISNFTAQPKFYSATQILQHDMNSAALPHPATELCFKTSEFLNLDLLLLNPVYLDSFQPFF